MQHLQHPRSLVDLLVQASVLQLAYRLVKEIAIKAVLELAALDVIRRVIKLALAAEIHAQVDVKILAPVVIIHALLVAADVQAHVLMDVMASVIKDAHRVQSHAVQVALEYAKGLILDM
jgi:hypothetical protein